MELKINLKLHENGVWEGTLLAGETNFTRLSHTPADACLELLDAAKLDGLQQYIKHIRERVEASANELALLIVDYQGATRQLSTLQKTVRAYLDGPVDPTVMQDLEELLKPWPPSP